MSLTFTDIFCGAGGSSTGLVSAGYELKLAANHWARAIETHAANHTTADHLCADVNNYDMRRLPKTDILWASPICTEMSPAAWPSPDPRADGSRARGVRQRSRGGVGADPGHCLRRHPGNRSPPVHGDPVRERRRVRGRLGAVRLVAHRHGDARLQLPDRLGFVGAHRRHGQRSGAAVAGPDLHRVHPQGRPPAGPEADSARPVRGVRRGRARRPVVAERPHGSGSTSSSTTTDARTLRAVTRSSSRTSGPPPRSSTGRTSACGSATAPSTDCAPWW